MRSGISLQAVSAGLLAAFVGLASSFAVVLQGLATVGATPSQAASGLMALSVGMGAAGVGLSLWRRLPVSIAWSTSGAALLATSGTPEGGFAAAVGGFVVCGVLLTLAGLWRPLGRAVQAIPPPLASAMLAGVLFGLCLAPVRAVAAGPAEALPVVLAWALVGRLRRLLAVPAAAAVAALVIGLGAAPVIPPGAWWPAPEFVVPVFNLSGLLGVGLPLFLVTMASQNIPGMAVLTVNGYRPAPGPLFTMTGLTSLAAAPFGGHAVNLAAITGALCASEGAHADPARRWWAALVAGLGYLVFGLLAGGAVAFVAAAPPLLIQAVAGLALLGTCAAALFAGLAVPETREPAIITFLVTASGASFFGISGAFWGLLAGGAALLLGRLRLG